MPIYEYNCLECGERFEVTHLSAESYRDIRCSGCGCGSVEKSFSTFAVAISSGSSAPPRCEMTGSCDTPNVPGCRSGRCGL